jgi:tRNA threonylcarbamoyladenosine biosynthesis protein TsaB
MRVLALDTALGATSAALFESRTGGVIASETMAMQRGHAESLMPMVERLMHKAGFPFSDIDRFAVTIGPGSFTGLRIGIAAARGFALAFNKPAVGISSLAAFAAPVLFGAERSPVAAAIDARHGMVFFQCMGIDGRALVSPGLFSVADAARATGDGPMVFVGNAAEMLAAAKKDILPDYRLDSGAVRAAMAPDITWVARLGAAADPLTAPARPLYLREANVTAQARGPLALTEP